MTLLKVAVRDYVCPVCGNEEEHSTNHEGEIYCNCKKCGNMGLYFKQDSRQFVPMFSLTYYRLDVGNPQEEAEYKEIVKKMDSKCFNVLVNPRSTFLDHLKNKKVISVHEPKTFDDQFITDSGRLHKWFEAVYPNRDIKEGYFLQKLTA